MFCRLQKQILGHISKTDSTSSTLLCVIQSKSPDAPSKQIFNGSFLLFIFYMTRFLASRQ